MDPMTLIMTALTAAAAPAGTALVSEAVKDGYAKLKDLIVRKFGAKSNVDAYLTTIEKATHSKELKEILQNELEIQGADKDKETVQAAISLFDLLKKEGLISGPKYQAVLRGSGAIAQGPGSVAAGEGGIAIGGDVHGNVTGSNQKERGDN